MINIVDEYGYDFDEQKILKYANYLDKNLKNKKDYSLVFVDDKQIQDLNQEFRNKNKPTDVLSFEEHTDDYLGDIIISVDTLKRQAIEYKHSQQRELFFLFTHGYLHLNGYDHLNKEDETVMMKLQDELLINFGIER